MKIVYGGAFNPVTKAHIEVYKFITENIEAKQFIFLPVSKNYSKSNLISNYHRIEMLKLATANFNNIAISNLETNDEKFLGTYQSLNRLKKNINDDIAFVIGADNLYSLHTWIDIKLLLSEFKIIILKRDGVNIKRIIEEDAILKLYKDSFIIFDGFDIKISSSLFRKTMQRELVDEKVYNYILDNDLYRGEENV